MSGGRRTWIPKKLGEISTIPFDFISDVQSGETLSSAKVMATVYSGVDAVPSAIISGSATINGTIVTQNIRAGVVGVIYSLLCHAHTSLGQVIEISTYCVIEPDLP